MSYVPDNDDRALAAPPRVLEPGGMGQGTILYMTEKDMRRAAKRRARSPLGFSPPPAKKRKA